MKVLIVAALFLACANASVINKIGEKLMPSFATGYIIQGEDAVPHSAPYIVSLSAKAAKHSHACGGTLIDRQWIVTAAHCIKNPVGMGIVAGLHHLADSTNTQARVVDYGRVHEQYTGGVGPYDIAILHVSKPFEYNEFIQPAVLPVPEQIHSGETHLYGWGQPKAFQFSAAKTLQTVETEVVEWNACKNMLPDDAPLHETNICSDSLQKGISACNGDSGGPLVKEHHGAPTELIGVVSWGYIPCGMGNKPSIYTRVSAYVDWIYSTRSAYATLY